MTSAARKTFVASFLGWTLDAYDFFLVIFVVPHLAHDFVRSITEIAIASTLTLALRPVGAFIFGWFADRYGRRTPLMIDIALYSLIELLTAFSPNFTIFLILRAIFGIAMGGEWGLGAALAMESLPAERRGLYSGILQEGYAVGNLLAGLTYGVLYPYIGWRGMFIIGAVPALLILYIRTQVPESPAWEANKAERLALGTDVLLDAVKRFFPLFIYGTVFMAMFNFMSHGTQDPYATFLIKQHHLAPHQVAIVNTVAAIGAILGGISFGALSQRIGRRLGITIAAVLAAFAIPIWAFSSTIATLALGGFIMQFMVQGAWGIIPAHLNEIAPPLARGTFPGFVYQLGNLIASGTLPIITSLAATQFITPFGPDYAKAMAIFTLFALIGLVILTSVGFVIRREGREKSFAPTAST